MPFEISSALNKERTLSTEIQLEGIEGLLPLSYYPNRVGEAERQLDVLKKAGKSDTYAEVEAIFLSLVTSWDVTSNGTPVPLTSDGLASIGMTSVVLSNIVGAVIFEAYAGEAKGTRLRKRS